MGGQPEEAAQPQGKAQPQGAAQPQEPTQPQEPAQPQELEREAVQQEKDQVRQAVPPPWPQQVELRPVSGREWPVPMV